MTSRDSDDGASGVPERSEAIAAVPEPAAPVDLAAARLRVGADELAIRRATRARTAANRMASVFRKLGVSSRREPFAHGRGRRS